MMNIALAGDRNVLSGIELVIYSTMLHNKNIHWYILTMDIAVPDRDGQMRQFYGITDEPTQTWLKWLVHFMDYNSDITFVDCAELYQQHLEHSVNRHTGFTPYASLRLLADLFMPFENDPQKMKPDDDFLLYLDADVIVQKNLESMYWGTLQWDQDYAAYTLPEACGGFGELISAVILFNLRRIRHTGLLNNARRNYNSKMYPFPDQGALYDAGLPVPLNETYNYMRDHKKCTYKPHIIHFSNENYTKIYNQSIPEGRFWEYYPEHQYLKIGLDAAKEIFENYHPGIPVRRRFSNMVM